MNVVPIRNQDGVWKPHFSNSKKIKHKSQTKIIKPNGEPSFDSENNSVSWENFLHPAITITPDSIIWYQYDENLPTSTLVSWYDLEAIENEIGELNQDGFEDLRIVNIGQTTELIGRMGDVVLGKLSLPPFSKPINPGIYKIIIRQVVESGEGNATIKIIFEREKTLSSTEFEILDLPNDHFEVTIGEKDWIKIIRGLIGEQKSSVPPKTSYEKMKDFQFKQINNDVEIEPPKIQFMYQYDHRLNFEEQRISEVDIHDLNGFIHHSFKTDKLGMSYKIKNLVKFSVLEDTCQKNICSIVTNHGREWESHIFCIGEYYLQIDILDLFIAESGALSVPVIGPDKKSLILRGPVDDGNVSDTNYSGNEGINRKDGFYKDKENWDLLFNPGDNDWGIESREKIRWRLNDDE